MNKNILFFINGEGLGNSTRCHAVIQKLLRNKVNIASEINGEELANWI